MGEQVNESIDSWSWSPVPALVLVLVGGAEEVLERSQPAFLRSNCRMRQYPTSLLPCLRVSCLRAQKFGLHAQLERTGHFSHSLDAAAAVGSSQKAVVRQLPLVSPLGYGRYPLLLSNIDLSVSSQASSFSCPPIRSTFTKPNSFLDHSPSHSLTVQSLVLSRTLVH